MIYLKDGNIPLNEAWADEIYQEGNSTYQLTFKYPLSSDKWKLLTEETELIADDLHGEQEFTIFEVVKEQGYITVYANQIATLLKSHSISSINVDRVAGNVVMTALAGAILRDCPFSFYSDITDKHTFNAANISVMDALIKEKHSIVGQWGGDLVRDKYQVSLLKNGGSETEALFMYKKNMRSPQQTTSTKELRTRIHFRKKIEVGEGDNRKEQWLRVTVDSPLISKYKHIYEDDMEVTDEDVKDLASLTKYGEQYYRTTLCDMIEDSLELDVAGIGDVPVKIFDIVSVYHEQFSIDVRKKITKYRYSPMGKRLKSVGFGIIQQTLGGALNAMVSDSVKAETAIIEQNFEVKLEKELKNADKVFDHKMNQMEQSLSDEIEQAKAKAEEVKAAMTDQMNLKINQSKSEVTDRLQKEFNQKLSSASADLAGVRTNLTQAQSRLSGDISQIQSNIAAIRGKQSQADNELVKQVHSINQAKSDLTGVKTDLTQAQSQLNSNISQIRSDVGAIRTKQTQTEAEISKQVQVLNATKTELAGVKSAQANYEQTTTRRLAELTNLADGKANRSELVQTAEELKSRIASVQASGRNLFLNSLFKQDIRKTGIWTTSTYTATIDSESKYLGQNALKIVGQDPTGKDGGNPKITYPATGQYGKVAPGSMTNQDVTISFYAKAENAGTILRSRLGNIWFKDGNVTLTTEAKRYVVKFSKAWTGLSNVTTNEWLFNLNRADTVWIWMPKFEVSDTDTPYSEAPEDIENQISAVESTFKQRADLLEASVTSLREGLKTKADSSALTVLSDSIKQSVKSLETDTQNKLNQKLSTAEFEVRASGIRQEILNATKDKADKVLVTAEAGRLREELASQIGSGRNLWINSKIAGNPVVEALPAGHITGQKQCYKLTNNQELSFNIEPDFSSRLFRKITFSAWVKYENVVRGANNWNVFNCFKHYMFLKNSKTGTVSGVSYLTLAGYDGTSDWKRIVFTYDYSTNKGYDQLKTLLKFNLEGVRSGTAWITGVQVEFGSVANEYAPAPEDVEGLITEAKATFERTAQGLRMDLSAIQSYVNADGTRAEALRTYSREETARQLTAERKLVEAGYVAKAQHAEDVRGLIRRFEELSEGGVNLLRNSAALLVGGDWRTGKWQATSGGNGTAQVVPVTSPPNPLIKSMIRIVNNTVGNKDLSQSAMALVVGQKYTVSCYARVASDSPSPTVGLLIRSWANNNDTNRKLHKTISNRDWQRYSFTFTADVVANSIQFGQSGAGSVEICAPKIELGAVATSWSPSPEDATSYADTRLAEYRQTVEGQLATVQSALNTANGSLTNFNNWKQSAQETLNKVGKVQTGLNETKTSLAEFKRTAEGQLSTITQQVAGKASQTEFKQKADSLEAGVNRLTEGLKTKADSSALNLLSDSIKQSVKSLETNMDNKLDSKLSTAEFEVRASGIRQEIVNATKDKADKALVTAEAGRLREELASLQVGGRNLLKGSKGPFKPNRNPANFDNNVLYHNETSVYMVNGQRYLISAKTDGIFTSHHDGLKESDNVVLWIMDKAVANYQIVSDAKTGTAGTEFVWNRPTGIYHLRVNTYRKDPEKLKSVWEVKVEQGSFKTDWSPAPEDTDGLITEAKATFERTAQGLRTDLSAVQAYVSADGTRAEALLSHSREETARQLTAERKLIDASYVGKAQHTEDVRGLTRRFEELKTSSETKLAEYRQTVDGQFATISSQIGESLKKTDISVTPGQIILGTGKVVNGQTLASLFVQNPESIEAITKLMRITGDLIVDGSITGRDLAARAITTPHLAAGSVTAEVLGANAVTADKVKADDALLEKLSAGEALLRKLMAKDAFINRLQSIDFTAEQIKGGLLRSIDGSLIFDLNKNTLTMSSNTAAIKRVLPGHPTQFMRYETERKNNVDYTRTIIGSNRNGSEKFDSVTFAGLVVENSNKAGIEDSLRLYGDNTYFRHAQGEVGWNINAVTQRIAPATWQTESAVWARNFVVPKHRNPNGRDWVKLEETVAALWRLWEHAAGNQVTMTGAMRDKVRELFQNYGYNYGIS